MKWKKFKKKGMFLTLCMFPVLFLCALSAKPIELLDDRKLIDLDKAIEFAKPGKDAFFPTDAASISDPNAGSADDPENKETTISIRIQWETVFYDGKECEYRALEKKLRKDSNADTIFRLEDDYAEAHVYTDTYHLLSGLKSEIGLRYKS